MFAEKWAQFSRHILMKYVYEQSMMMMMMSLFFLLLSLHMTDCGWADNPYENLI